MYNSEFSPGELGKGVGIPLNGATSTDKERRQAGTRRRSKRTSIIK